MGDAAPPYLANLVWNKIWARTGEIMQISIWSKPNRTELIKILCDYSIVKYSTRIIVVAFSACAFSIFVNVFYIEIAVAQPNPILNYPPNSAKNIIDIAGTYAQTNTNTPEERYFWAANILESVIQRVTNFGRDNFNGKELSDVIAYMYRRFPLYAGEFTTAILNFAENGTNQIPANDSLRESLADGVAFAVTEFQNSASLSPLAAGALQAINEAFLEAQVSRGSVFGARFASTQNLEGGLLLPPVLAGSDSPLQVIVPFLQESSLSVFSPN